MGLQGSFEAFSLPEVMQLIASGDRNGWLTIACESDARIVRFHRGRVVGVSGLAHRFRLVHALLQSGRIDPIALAELGLDLDDESALERALLERGMITEQQLQETAHRQIQEALDDVFQWRDGGFLFRDAVDEPEPGSFAFPVQPLLMEALRKQDEWQQLAARFSNPDAVPVFVEDEAQIASLPPGANDAFTLLELVDGRSSLRVICRRSGFSNYRALRALAMLQQAGLVRIRTGATSRLNLGAELGTQRHIPVMPRAGARALAVATYEQPDRTTLRELALSDPGIAVALLETAAARPGAETARFGTIDDALDRLGEREAREVLVVCGLRGLYASSEAAWPALWRHALACAEAARHVGRLLKLEPREIERLRLAGLLHDVGCFVLRRSNPVRYRAALEEVEAGGEPLFLVERRRFGVSHESVGAKLLGEHGVEPVVCEAITAHHRLEADDPGSPIAAALQVAEVLAQTHLPHPEGGRPPELGALLQRHFGLPPAAARALERSFVRTCAGREPLW